MANNYEVGARVYKRLRMRGVSHEIAFARANKAMARSSRKKKR